MPIVKTNFGVGGSGLSAGHANPDSLAEVLRGLVDDLASNATTTISSNDGSFTEIVSADATDLASAQTLANEIKAAYNADITRINTLVNEIKTVLNAVASATPPVTKG